MSTIRLPRKMVRIACHQFMPPPMSDDASMYVGMQADMEIQRAAKLPRRHLRREAGTGARAEVERVLFCSSTNWRSVNSFASAFIGWPEAQAHLICKLIWPETAIWSKLEGERATPNDARIQ